MNDGVDWNFVEELSAEIQDPRSSLNRQLTVETEVQEMLEEVMRIRKGKALRLPFPTCSTRQKILMHVCKIVEIVSDAGWIE